MPADIQLFSLKEYSNTYIHLRCVQSDLRDDCIIRNNYNTLKSFKTLVSFDLLSSSCNNFHTNLFSKQNDIYCSINDIFDYFFTTKDC